MLQYIGTKLNETTISFETIPKAAIVKSKVVIYQMMILVHTSLFLLTKSE